MAELKSSHGKEARKDQRNFFLILKEKKSAIIIQKWFRGFAQRKKFKMEMRSIITIQKFARGFLVRKSLKEQRNAALILKKNGCHQSNQ